jgi:phosphoglycerol transferase MdoB-like AlkP superfamily enzyme
MLVSPLLVSDRNGNLHHLQYSSILGRKIVYRQFAATLLSAFALTTLLILIFVAVYGVNGTYLFWNSNLSSDFNIGIYTVFSLTYGGWVIAMVALMYVLALGVSAFAFIISRFSRNLITLVMKLIPIFAAIAYLSVSVFNQLFTMLDNKLYLLLRVFGAEVYVCGVFAVIAITAALFVVRKEKSADVG